MQPKMSHDQLYSLNTWARNRPGDFIDRLSSYSLGPTPANPTANRNDRYVRTATHRRQASLRVQRGDYASSRASTYDVSVPRTVPSLAGVSVSTPYSASLNTDRASEINAQNILYPDENDNLIAPEAKKAFISHCIFHLLGCRKISDNVADWKAHVTGHFKSQPIPLSVTCQLCKKSFHGAREGEAWSWLLDHIVTQHTQQGQTLVGTSPGFELMHYLYCKGIVSLEDLRLIQNEAPVDTAQCASIAPTYEDCFYNASSRRERRLKKRQL
ncbi:hypothetical protein LOZ58_005669 [Ophidiomyces ophidiicola]|nr:hypothetical protein LOZ65_003712 [Ophidiomyces ophidiicola]KAI1957583.1 hypothetical protein LOZ58_005669 [Ophidiomyces ophidiicola]